MKLQDFYFDLPEKLIAQYPLDKRSDSKLLVYDRKNSSYTHTDFSAIIDFLEAGDLLVMNDSKVIPARFYGKKITGAKVEFLLERIIDNNTFLTHIKSGKAPKNGSLINLINNRQIEIIKRYELDESLFICKANDNIHKILAEIGHIPLPPYIARQTENIDKTRYQTVYAKHEGSVAAPTAGLHFDSCLVEKLQNKGIELGYLTLHVGAGTFRPVRTQNIYEHKMHTEYFHINEQLCEKIIQTKALNRRIIAVGTTTLRTLESFDGKSGYGSTNIFITPGFKFNICDGLITNFHLPESTLLMLVAALIGYNEMQQLYDIAITENYRFFSYGDASLLL